MNSNHFHCWPPLVALTLSAAGAQAMQPLFTDDTGTQGDGRHQLEWAYARDRASTPPDAPANHEQSTVYTLGLHERLDVFAGASLVQAEGRRGWGNPVIGMKWRLHESDDTSWAVKSELAGPISAARERQGLGTGRPSGALTLILTQKMPFGEWHFNVMRGEDRFRAHAGENTRYSKYSMAPVWALAPDWKLALDLGLQHARTAGASTRSRYALVGVVWSMRPELDWDAGLMQSREQGDQTTHTRLFTAGLTWRF